MKIPTTTFLCDHPRCPEALTVHEDSEHATSAYLELVEAGWRVERPIMTGWKHFCTSHPDGSEGVRREKEQKR